MDNPKVFIYCRQSKGKEVESLSISVQEKTCREYAKSHHLNVIGVFADPNTNGHVYPAGFEEKSLMDSSLQKWLKNTPGEKNIRNGLGSLFKRLSEVDGILVVDLTRLYRPLSYSNLANEINFAFTQRNILLYSVKEGTINFQKNTDKLVTNIQSQVNDMQFSITHEKSRASMRKIKDDGYIPTSPKMFGIRYIGGPERAVEVIPGCDKVIRFVFDSILSYTPYNQIVRELNSRFSELCKGKAFYDSSWRNIVKQPFYCGYMYNGNGELIQAKQMAGKEIITFQEWQQALDIVNSPKHLRPHNKSLVHPFSGILTCGYCGAKLLTGLDKGKEYYHCVTGKNKGNKECSGARVTLNLVRKSDLFTGLRESICPFLILGLYHKLNEQNLVVKNIGKIADGKAKLLNYEKRQEELAEVFSEGELTVTAYKNATNALENKIRKLKSKILDMENIASSASQNEKKIRQFFVELDKLMNNEIDDVTYKELLRSSIFNIKCYQDYITIESVYGTVDLPRYIYKQYRNFPRFNYVKYPISHFLENFQSSRLEIFYHYDKDMEKKLIADFKVMKIYIEK